MECLVREPDAGNRPVRFDERGVETEPQATAPLLDSTHRCSRCQKIEPTPVAPFRFPLSFPPAGKKNRHHPPVGFLTPSPRRDERVRKPAFRKMCRSSRPPPRVTSAIGALNRAGSAPGVVELVEDA